MRKSPGGQPAGALAPILLSSYLSDRRRMYMQPGEIIDSSTCFRRSREDCPRVIAQHLEPRVHIGSVIQPWRIGDAKVGAQKRRTKLGNKLFHRICVVTEAIDEIAVQPRRMARPMRELVEERRVIVFGGVAGTRC